MIETKLLANYILGIVDVNCGDIYGIHSGGGTG
jgi:hypothetical protein